MTRFSIFLYLLFLISTISSIHISSRDLISISTPSFSKLTTDDAGQVIKDYELLEIDLPKVVLYGYEFECQVDVVFNKVVENARIPYKVYEGPASTNGKLISEGTLKVDLETTIQLSGSAKQGQYLASYQLTGLTVSDSVARTVTVVLYDEGKEIGQLKGTVNGMPGWVTLIPIIVLLAIALFSSQALVALVCGVFLSATFINGFNPLTGFLKMLDYYTINSLADKDHSKIAMFTFYLSGMIAMIQKSGGAKALADLLTTYATTRKKGQWATFLVGVLIFLDDTASIMIVGANFQPVTDRLYLSREKLAFLVHATSSPVSSLSPVSSWIGFQVGLIALQLQSLKINQDAFLMFLQTVPSRYYPIFMLLFTMMTIQLGREFGPMLTAERRAYHENKVVASDTPQLIGEMDPLEPKPDTPKRWINAAIPILITILITILSLLLTGYYSLVAQQDRYPTTTVEFSIQAIAGAGDPYGALLYASFSGCLACIFMYTAQRILCLGECLEVLIHGVKDVVETLIILILAWAIGNAFLDLNCAKFLISALSSSFPKGLIPSLSFILACVISFTTGTSWGTTTIMFPLVIPLAHNADPGSQNLLLATVSAILAGALFGDQSSPISSTTILTCLTSKVPVRAHVNSQLPYTILVSLTSLIFGYLPIGYDLYPDWAGLLIGTAVMLLVLFLVGDQTESVDQFTSTNKNWRQKVLSAFRIKKSTSAVSQDPLNHPYNIDIEENINPSPLILPNKKTLTVPQP